MKLRAAGQGSMGGIFATKGLERKAACGKKRVRLYSGREVDGE